MNYRENFLKSINKIAEKEIDKVNINQHYLEVLESQDKEIEKLNNIINELEHYLKLEKWKSVGGIHLGVINGVLNKLQELKGSDKVE